VKVNKIRRKQMATNSNMHTGSTVAGLFRDRASADKAVRDLQTVGFAKDQIEEFGDPRIHDPSGGGFLEKLLHFFGGTPERTATGTIGTMPDDLVAMGLTKEDAHHFQSGLEAGGVLVMLHAGSQANEAISTLERYGADTGTVDLNPVATPSTDADLATTNTGAQRLELLKEVLRVNKQRVQTGEVTLRKEVISETQTVEVPLTHEELVIKRRPVTDAEAVTGEIGTDQEIRVQLSEERVTVEKRPVVTEEVIVGKREVQQTEQVQETVRREELRTERQGNVTIDEALDKPLS